MVHSSPSQCLLGLARSFKRLSTADPVVQCLAPSFTRSFASAVETSVVESIHGIELETSSSEPASTSGRVLTTLYSWPNLEPRQFAYYPSQYLDLPLRKDILHRAVIYENDKNYGMRTASTKYRTAVHGSNRKIAPQKGLGRARVGDKKSPIRRGGGVAFGPHPRDYTTELPRKIYDLAWRTALSFRYRRGELVVLDNRIAVAEDATPRFLENVFVGNRWDRQHGGFLMVSDRVKKGDAVTEEDQSVIAMQDKLWDIMGQMKEARHGNIKDLEELDIRDLLKGGRVVIDKFSLDRLLASHTNDLKSKIVKVC